MCYVRAVLCCSVCVICVMLTGQQLARNCSSTPGVGWREAALSHRCSAAGMCKHYWNYCSTFCIDRLYWWILVVNNIDKLTFPTSGSGELLRYHEQMINHFKSQFHEYSRASVDRVLVWKMCCCQRQHSTDFLEKITKFYFCNIIFHHRNLYPNPWV